VSIASLLFYVDDYLGLMLSTLIQQPTHRLEAGLLRLI
jgi:hypothetical protein